MDRRNFVRLSSLAAAGGLLNGRLGSTPALAGQAQLKCITVKVLGGLAVVFTNKDRLEVGTVKIPAQPPRGCTYAQHGLELRRLHGTVKKDDTGLDSYDGDGNPLNVWDVSEQRITFAAGVTSQKITSPPDHSASQPETPLDGHLPWDDLAWMFAPTRHHTPSALRHDWQTRLAGCMEFPGGIMNVDPPAPSCALLGVWEYRNPAGTKKFCRTIADRFTVQMDGGGEELALKVGGKDLVFLPEAGGAVSLQLRATSHGFKYEYKLDESWPHVASYYELVTGSSDPNADEEIPCHERLIPHYASFKGQKQGCPSCCLKGECHCTPGEQCPAAVFNES